MAWRNSKPATCLFRAFRACQAQIIADSQDIRKGIRQRLRTCEIAVRPCTIFCRHNAACKLAKQAGTSR
jgi:hypothetical protein